ncbi:tetratricopeptide repeat protein [Saccharococcus sp. Marseille-Q5394]|uniref:tetratricopeptide repeat protein n=1 Tax=Saccharococcus sp. Marseille-Q5394 TaxID=2972778 RepID=UPI0021C9905C|nr:tetratricopeptide repeat protein [Saccharococcus sp. Marseille-Q5394]
MNRVLLTDEERLQALYKKLRESRRSGPIGFSAPLAQLSYRILQLERKLKIHDPVRRYDCIGIMMEQAYYMKTEQKDRHVAKLTFEQILRLDPHNPEANYRYAFLHYEDGEWVKAIRFFKAAIQDNSSDFPLAKDQIVKANLFISYCAMMLVKESMRTVEDLKSDKKLDTEGVSIDELTANVKTLLAQTEYRLVSNEGEEFISKVRYEELESNVESGAIWLDMTLDQPYVKSGYQSKEISRLNGILLKRLLLKSAKQETLALAEISGYQEEFVAESHDVSWENYRQKIRRLNQRLSDVGLPVQFIQHVTGTQSYKIEPCKFSIIENEAN